MYFPYDLAATGNRQAHVYEMRMNGNISHSVHIRTDSDKLTNSFLFNFFVYFKKFLEQHIITYIYILLFRSSDYDKCMSLISLICTYAKNFQTTIEMSGVAEITKGKCLSNKSNQIFHSWKSLIKKSRQDIKSVELLLFLLSASTELGSRYQNSHLSIPNQRNECSYPMSVMFLTSFEVWEVRPGLLFSVWIWNWDDLWNERVQVVYWEIEMSASFLRRHLLLGNWYALLCTWCWYVWINILHPEINSEKAPHNRIAD